MSIEHRGDGGLVATRNGAVLLLRLDLPSTRNSLTNDVLRELAGRLAAADASEGVRAIVVSGSEKVFASGANLHDLAALSPDDDAFADRARSWDDIRRTATPTIAAVSGYCLGGGCELALACDIIVASATAVFGLPETSLGLIPGAGGTQRLIRAIGKAKAMEVTLAGRLLAAAEAEAAGLAARVCEPGTELQVAVGIAETIAARSPLAIRLAKNAVRGAQEESLETGLASERAAFAQAFASPDAREGIAAFIEKREPRWPSITSS
jgi:enoyl-CoA hydratase